MFDDHPTTATRLGKELIAWLTTVSAAGVPSTAPVWFLLEPDGSILVYSKDPSIRVRNIRANPNVTLHLEGDGVGGAIAVVNGTAVIDDDAPQADRKPEYIEKYRPLLERYGWSAAWFAERYPRPIRIAVRSVRGG